MPRQLILNCSEHWHVRIFTGFMGFSSKIKQKWTEVIFQSTVKTVIFEYFQIWSHLIWCIIRCRLWFCHQTHQLKLRFDWDIDVQRQTTPQKLPNASISHVAIPAKPIKIHCFSKSGHVLGSGIRWKIWFCHQTWPGSMIWLCCGWSKSKSALKARCVRKGLISFFTQRRRFLPVAWTKKNRRNSKLMPLLIVQQGQGPHSGVNVALVRFPRAITGISMTILTWNIRQI
jgi:hypothetical protein